MSEHPELVVIADPPPAPLILASTAFLSTLAEVEEQTRNLKITDANAAQLAGQLQIRLTSAGSTLEKQRQALKAPFLEIGRKIDAAAQAPSLRIEAAKNLLKRGLSAFDTEQRRIAAEEEQKKQAELQRLEAIRQEELRQEQERKAELEEAARKAAAVASPPVESMDFDEGEDTPPEPPPEPVKTETQVAIERLTHAPVAAPVRPTGITFKTTLVPVVVNIHQVPDSFVEKTPKLRALTATFCAGWREGDELPVCAGVRFEVKREPVSTGRSTF